MSKDAGEQDRAELRAEMVLDDQLSVSVQASRFDRQSEASGGGGAGAPSEEGSGDVLAWQEEKVRADVKQTYPLRLPEPLHLKLKFLASETGKSMNELCNEAVRDLVETRLDEVLEEER